MQRLLLLLAGLLFLAGPARAQPTKLWQRTYTYPRYNRYDIDMIRLSPNRLLVVGESHTGFGSEDSVGNAASLWFYNNQGDTVGVRNHFPSRRIISQSIGEPQHTYAGVVKAPNGDLLLNGIRFAGTLQGVFYPAAGFCSRTDSTGTIIRWMRYDIGGPGSGNLRKTLALPDGGLLVIYAVAAPQAPGQGVPVAAALRLDSLGNVVWRRTYGRAYSEFLSLVPLPDGSYALTGYYPEPIPNTGLVGAKGWLLQITASGDTVRSRFFGTPANRTYIQEAKAGTQGGVLLVGAIRSNTVSNQLQGWLMQLDSLARPRWQQVLPAVLSATTPNYALLHVQALAGGSALITGSRSPHGFLNNALGQLMAVYRPTGTGGAQLVWERSVAPGSEPDSRQDLNAAGELTLSGSFNTGIQYGSALARFQLAERPYVPSLCQTPPQALLGYVRTSGGDSLRFVNLSSAGPPYAQLLRWRWDFGDGTRYDGPTPPPHRYAPGSGAATAVRLTVTNNLGCTSTAVVFPLALATAAQRALQAQLSVFPNPAGPVGGATVRLPGLRPQPPVAAELLNALGQAVWRGSWPVAALAQGAALPVTGAAAGVYTLRLRPQEGTVVKRLVVQ